MEQNPQDADVMRSLPILSLPSSTKQILSDLLNSTKVIPTAGPNSLPRDWRGLATLANISAEVVSSIYNYPDKTNRVLELWIRDSQPTVGNLLDNLETLERYDVHEDICLDLTNPSTKRDLRIGNSSSSPLPTNNIPPRNISEELELLTYDDAPGYRHQYDAYVLYAEKDNAFVEQMKVYLNGRGFQICTKDRLLPGFATEYAPISKLISERCRRIILVYSPEFLDSPDNSFYRDYAQAVSIGTRTNMTIPIMYRPCTLPPHTALYHMLRYNTEMYDFWDKLAQSLRIATMPSITQNGHSVSSPAMNTGDGPPGDSASVGPEPRGAAGRCASVGAVPSSSSEGSIISETSLKAKKKSGFFGKIFKKVIGKKSKNAIMVQ